MDNGKVQGAQFAGNPATRGKEILEHQAKRYLMLGEFSLPDIAHAIVLFFFFQHIKNSSAAGFLITVQVAPHGRCLLCRLVRDFVRQPEIERADRAGLNAEGLLVLAHPVAAHGALRRFIRDVVLGDHAPGTGIDTVFTADTDLRIDDDRPFFVFRDRFDGANGGAGRKLAVHTTVSGPKRRKTFEHRRFHRDPV